MSIRTGENSLICRSITMDVIDRKGLMSEAFRHFEKIAPLISPILLVLPGVIYVLCGLCMWLGGLKWSKFFACLLGCVCGLVCGFLFTSNGVLVIFGVAVIWMLFGLIFDKITITFP